MRKIISLSILVSIITLTAHANNFYEQERNYHYPSQYNQVQTRHIQGLNRALQVRSSLLYQQQNFKVSAAEARKFGYASRAAKSGHAQAQFDLAIMYATGTGVLKSEKIAFNWFHKAARNNHAAAKHYMGISFLQGRGVRKQSHLARYWFKLATKQGYKQSARYLSQVERLLNKKKYKV